MTELEHNCETCGKKVGETCKRKRKQLIGYCLDWEPKTSLGGKT